MSQIIQSISPMEMWQKIRKAVIGLHKAESSQFVNLLDEAGFDKSRLPGTHWSSLSFDGQDLRSLNFLGATFEKCSFRGAQILGTNFDNACMIETDLTSASDWCEFVCNIYGQSGSDDFLDRVRMLRQMKSQNGIVAALDHSGGSTPKALAAYGIGPDSWSTDEEMFDRVHEMRKRIMTSPQFTNAHILAAIIFEQTMDRKIGDLYVSEFLWKERGIIPFLKIDRGLAPEANGVQKMNPIPSLQALLERAHGLGVFGTKMRSVIHSANFSGISGLVDQQFEYASQIKKYGLFPIIEPEVNITIEQKSDAENALLQLILERLGKLSVGEQVILKLTLPEEDGLYQPLMDHPNVLRVTALSGGYSKNEAIARLARNPGMIASFARALIEGLSSRQNAPEFDQHLSGTIKAIYEASASDL